MKENAEGRDEREGERVNEGEKMAGPLRYIWFESWGGSPAGVRGCDPTGAEGHTLCLTPPVGPADTAMVRGAWSRLGGNY